MIQTNPIPTDNPSGALIGYIDLITGSVPSAEKALTPNTYERHTIIAGTFTLKFQLSTIAAIDYIAIAAHTFSGETIDIQTAETIGGATTHVETVSPVTNGAIMINFDPVTVEEIILTGTLSESVEMGVIRAGPALQMPRNIYGGHSPASLSQKTKYQSVRSESGNFLSRNIVRQGLETEFNWQNLDVDWYRQSFQPFVLAARLQPFFIKWRPDHHANEVIYAETSGDISPSNQGGGNRLINVSLSVKGHADL